MPRPPDQPGVLPTQARAAQRVAKVERRTPIASSGGGTSTLFGVYQDLGESIPQNSAFGMDFTFGSGTALLDLSNTFNPAVLTDGLYAFTVYAAPSSPQAGAVAELFIDLDTAGANNTHLNTAPLDAASASGTRRPSVGLTVVYYLAASQKIDVNLAHSVAGSVSFDFQVIVQKIS